MRVDTKERPAEYLLETREVVAFRVRGRPRDVESGKHKTVVLFCDPTLTTGRLATLLRSAADALAPRETPFYTIGIGCSCRTTFS